jgi:DNA-3-methyladenine glycosylase
VSRRDSLKYRRLGRRFFSRPADQVAPDLIGKILVHRQAPPLPLLRARIVETEAYVGEHDLACHSSRGRTARTNVMFGSAGYAYVYFIYGMHEMFNIVTARPGDAQAVLLRAAEPLDGWKANLTGPGRLARGMAITRADHNALDLTRSGGVLFLEDNPADRPRVIITRRVGVDYAGDWKDAMLRFLDADSAAVSKPRPRARAAGTARWGR